MVAQEQRKVGTATVYRATDGKVYGQADLKSGTSFYRLFEGRAETIAQAQMGQRAATGAIYWGNQSGAFPDGRVLSGFSLESKRFTVRDPKTGATKQGRFDYKSEGTHLRVLTAGPDGKVWGNSAHPSRGFVYDPQTGVLKHHEGAIAVKGYAIQGRHIIGGHYTGGVLYVFDTAKPWQMTPTAARLEGALTARDLMPLASSDDGKIDLLDDYALVLFRANDYGGQMHFSLSVKQDGQYRLVIASYQSPGYGAVQFLLDGQPLGEPYRGYSKTVQPGPLQALGPVDLKAGQHRLSLKTMKAEGGNPWMGISAVCLTDKDPEQVIHKAEPGNPRAVARYAPDINVPVGAAAHPDGQHVMISGNPGYGYTGGGIGIYNLDTGESRLLTHAQLIPKHCVQAMAPLPNGDIVCGSSTHGGHGTEAVGGEAVLFILDWASKKISFQASPVPRATEIRFLRTGPDGFVCGLADAASFFVFDPQKRQVVHSASLASYGSAAYNGMDIGPDGNIYVAFSKAILRIKPGIFAVEKIADTPDAITGGLAVLGGRVYFAIGSHLWSVNQ